MLFTPTEPYVCPSCHVQGEPGTRCGDRRLFFVEPHSLAVAPKIHQMGQLVADR